MLHKCANPACPSLSHSLNLGKLFLLETDNCETMTSGTTFRVEESVRFVAWSATGYAMAVPPYSPWRLNEGKEW